MFHDQRSLRLIPLKKRVKRKKFIAIPLSRAKSYAIFTVKIPISVRVVS